jgi:hypothetical protein
MVLIDSNLVVPEKPHISPAIGSQDPRIQSGRLTILKQVYSHSEGNILEEQIAKPATRRFRY